MSTFLPGLGQVYNKKYWKVPLLYAGFAGLTYALIQNQSKFVNYRDAYKYRTDGDSTTIDKYIYYYSDASLFDLQKHYNRLRDMSLIGIGLLYVVNILDASVDAHLFTFDVNDNLSLNIQPQLLYTASNGHYRTGLTINFNF